MKEPLTDEQIAASADRYYGYLVKKHPWFYEAFRANEIITRQKEIGRLKGLHLIDALPKCRALTLDDEIDFAKAIRDQSDMWQYFVDWASGHLPALDGDLGERVDPYFHEAMSYFICLFFFQRNMWVHASNMMHGGRAVVQSVARGELSVIDSPEARELAAKFHKPNWLLD